MERTEKFYSHSEAETHQLALRFAATLHEGDIIALHGELGSGKTHFIRGVMEYFHCQEQLSSPTFSLFNIYQGMAEGNAIELHHFDLYRLESPRELEAIGFSEYLSNSYLSMVEWADKFPEYQPLYNITVTLAYASATERHITITRH